MAAKVEIFKKLIKPNDILCIEIVGICNSGKEIATDVRVLISTPVGLEFESATLPKGTYDETTGIWTIGTLYPGELFSGEDTPSFCYKVSDCTDINGVPLDEATIQSIEDGSYTGVLADLKTGDCFAPYTWNPIIEIDGCEDCDSSDNTYCITIDGITCCDIKNCTEAGKLNCELITL